MSPSSSHLDEKCSRRDSNPRPPGPQPGAPFQLSYGNVSARAGNRTLPFGLSNRRSSTELRKRTVPTPGIEPGSSALQADAWTTAARSAIRSRPGGSRTLILARKRRLLCQSSFRPRCERGEDRTHHAPEGAAGLRPAGPPLVTSRSRPETTRREGSDRASSLSAVGRRWSSWASCWVLTEVRFGPDGAEGVDG